MIRKLKWWFTLTSTGLTSLVLIVLTVILLRLNVAQIETRYDSVLQNVFESVLGRLWYDTAIDDDWLRELERDNQCIIDISENGKSLFYQGGYQANTSRNVLISRAAETADVKYGVTYSDRTILSLQPTEAEFTLLGEAGEEYRVKVRLIQLRDNSYARLMVIVDSTSFQTEVIQIRWIYSVLVSVSIFLLLCIFRFMAELISKPVQNSIRQQNEFIASASHELRGPLAVLTAAVSYAEQSDKYESLLPQVKRETNRMVRIVNDLLLLARNDAADWSMIKEPTELEVLLLEVMERMIPTVQQVGRQLNIRMPDQLLPAVRVDKTRVAQVLEILIRNACDHSGDGGEILLVAEMKKDHVEISVVDHGIGIPDTEKRKVFNRFYRVDKSRTDRDHSGLGLSIALDYVKAHNGSITVIDTPGGGATFMVRLPK